MAASFDQLLGTSQSKTAGASLVISPSSKTVTVGRTVFVAFASDDIGSSYSIIDNLGNTYSLINEVISAGAVKTQLWSAPVTVGGAITSITTGWTTNATAKAAVAGEFSNFGSLRLVSGSAQALGVSVMIDTNDFFVGELWIGAAGVEDDIPIGVGGFSGTPTQSPLLAGSIGTSGGGSASNISVTLAYTLIAVNGVTYTFQGNTSGSSAQNSAGSGAIYNSAFVATDGTATAPKGVWDPHLVPKAWF
jgi:hypothetical protein